MTEKLKADDDEVTQDENVRMVYRFLIALARWVPLDVKQSLRTFAIEVGLLCKTLFDEMHVGALPDLLSTRFIISFKVFKDQHYCLCYC